MRLVLAATAALSFAMLAAPALGAPGDRDTSFGTGGVATAMFPEGESHGQGMATKGDDISVAGVVTGSVPGGGDYAVARFTKKGVLDTSFSSDGMTTFDFAGDYDQATSTAYQGDKLVVAGFAFNPATNDFDFGVARLNKDGSLDTTFSGDGKVLIDFAGGDDFGDAVMVRGDKIIVGGAGQSANGDNDFALVQLNKDGSVDFKQLDDFRGTQTNDAINGLAQMGDNIVAAGYSDGDFAVAKYKKTGAVDSKMTADFGGDDFGHSVDVKGDKIAVFGESDGNWALAQFGKTGAVDFQTTHDFGGQDAAFSGMYDNDRLTAVGTTPDAPFGNVFALGRWLGNGTADTAFSGDGFATDQVGATSSAAYAMALGPDQTLLAAGDADDGSQFNTVVVRYQDKKK